MEKIDLNLIFNEVHTLIIIIRGKLPVEKLHLKIIDVFDPSVLPKKNSI